MNTDEVCDLLASTLASLIEAPSVGMPRIELRSPAPPETNQGAAFADRETTRRSMTGSDDEPRRRPATAQRQFQTRFAFPRRMSSRSSAGIEWNCFSTTWRDFGHDVTGCG